MCTEQEGPGGPPESPDHVASSAPGEIEAHAEHEAALEITLFQRAGRRSGELVLELNEGQLRIVSTES